MADGKQLPCKGLPPHGKPWGFRPRNEEGFIMTMTKLTKAIKTFVHDTYQKYKAEGE